MSAQQDVVRGFTAAGEAVSVSGSSAQSAVFPATGPTKGVRLVSTTNCFVEIGANPTAAANTSTYLPAGVVEYFACAAGHRVAVIQASASGTLYVRPTN